jgi:hypothetical protein
MLVESGCPAVNTGRVVAELDGAVQHDSRAMVIVVKADKHFSSCDMRVVNPVRRVVHGPYRYLVAECFDYFASGARRCPSADGFVHILFVADPSAIVSGSFIGYEVFSPNKLT